MLRSRRDAVAALVAIILATVVAVSARRDDQQNYGYDPDPDGAARFARSLDQPTYSVAAEDAMQRTELRDVFLWRAADAAHLERYGVPWKPSNQRSIGSCVAHAACHVVYIGACVSWQSGQRPEPPLLPHQASVYGGARVESKGLDGSGTSPVGGYRDGATGFSAARWLRDWGVVWKKQYPSRDCSISNPEIEREAGAYGCGGKGDGGRLDNAAKEFPCLYVTQIRTWDELCVALCNGHCISLCSSQGFTRTLDSESFASPKGTWMHALCAAGLRLGKRPGVAIVNSWGDYITYTAPRWPADLPDGTFWADKSVIEKMLRSGDCWCISDVQFNYRPIRHDEWLGAGNED